MLSTSPSPSPRPPPTPARPQACHNPHPSPARLRILTSDYLDITDPEALLVLMLLRQQNALGGPIHCKDQNMNLPS